ncbi:alpha/beta-hydrolase [Piedraia hortae CBS 480.64]|uniref:Alpha/beta-hydrolase n=1 Tax=Piedraia hortae CBS 480.64 TaxID=1314780 RepID=A0A6A7C989_9PEZI|nr:alpha/beta-hydrolase [Piedraia hortae CBS 480.64]
MSSSTIWSYALFPLYLTGGLTTLLASAAYFYQNSIIYMRNFPDDARSHIPRPSHFGISHYEEVSLHTSDNETLHAFLIKPEATPRRVTVVMFHGNAGNIGYRIPIARVLANDLFCSVLMVEYRGYGLSSGKPDERGLKVDAQTALEFVRGREDLRDNKVVVYGQSLGGAVAIDLVVRNEGMVDGLVLENTFLSIPKMVPNVLPAARFLTPLCTERWDSERIIPTITKIPILFLSALRDEIIPPAHMKQLYRLCKTKDVVWKELPTGDHNNSVMEPYYFHYFEDFLEKYVL